MWSVVNESMQNIQPNRGGMALTYRVHLSIIT